MASTPDDDLARRLREDASPVELSAGLRDRVAARASRRGGRAGLWSLATPWRRGLAVVGLLVVAWLLVVAQGVRTDLDDAGWFTFAAAGVPMGGVGLLAAAQALAHRGRPIRLTWWAIGLAWVWMLGWSGLGPWPGVTGVPAAMHLHCFGMTSVGAVLGTLWIGLLERAPGPVGWRWGLAAAGAGLVAFAAQSVFCPGIDLIHLLVGHGGASVVWALIAVAAAWLWSPH